MQCDPVNLHWMWRETGDRLRVMHTRVREGQDVLAASEFARWLRMSGILTIFRDNPQSEPLEVDERKIVKQIDDLLWDCGERLKRDQPGYVGLGVVERVERKLDLIAGELIRLARPSPAVNGERKEVIPNGKEFHNLRAVRSASRKRHVDKSRGRRMA